MTRSKQSKMRSSFSGTAVAVKTRSPHTIGEACPTPGTAVFQTALATFQRFGTFVSKLVPSALGPRQSGQFSALAELGKLKKPSKRPANNIGHV